MRFSPVSDKLEPRTRINVDFKPNKKMKKRRELDALVNNGKTTRRTLSTSKKGSHVHELLRSGDDDDDDSNSSDELEFSLSAQDKTVIRKKSRHCHTHAACVPICAFLMVVLCLLVCGGLVWFLYELRKDINTIRSEVHTVESLDQSNPEEFQSLHSGLKALDDEVQGAKGLQYLDMQTQAISKQLNSLNATTEQLWKGIAAAKSLQSLPERVQQITQNVASLGSTVKSLQTKVDDLLPRYSGIELKQTQLEDDIQKLKAAIESYSTTISTTPITSTVALDSPTSTAEPSSARLDAIARSLTTLNVSVLAVDAKVSNLYSRVNTTQINDAGEIYYMVQSAMNDYQNQHEANMSLLYDLVTEVNRSLSSVRLDVDKSTRNISDLSRSLAELNKTVSSYQNIAMAPTPTPTGSIASVIVTTASYPSSSSEPVTKSPKTVPGEVPPHGTGDSSNRRRRSVHEALLHKFARVLARP